MSATDPLPWGDCNPDGGFKVGDRVGLIYSDHEEYVFDNPVGVVTAVEDQCEDDDHPDPCPECQWITVAVEASISADRVYLIERAPSEAPDG